MLALEEKSCSKTSVRELSMERMDNEFKEAELYNIWVGV